MVIRGGEKVDLRNPKPSNFKPELVARSLSYLNRFAGSYGEYSVAQHAVNVAIVVEELGGDPVQKLAALHHDDAEAVTNDTPSPWKKLLGAAFYEAEARLNRAINERYMIDVDDELVKFADQQLLVNEVLKLVPPEYRKQYYPLPSPKVILPYKYLIPWGADKAFATYMDLHTSLERDCLVYWKKKSEGNDA